MYAIPRRPQNQIGVLPTRPSLILLIASIIASVRAWAAQPHPLQGSL